MNRHLAKLVLERGANYRVDAVENGAEALRAVEEEVFDLVLMDLDMPVMDGFEAAAAIRARGDVKGRTPIVAFSVLSSESDRARAAGMDGLLAKPFDPATFLATVEGFIRRGQDDEQAGAPGVAGRSSSPDLRPAIWNRSTYAYLGSRLGPTRVGQALLMFESRLVRAQAALLPGSDLPRRLAFEAHALVSSAGMLGFEDLGAASSSAQAIAAPAGDDRPDSSRVEEAAEHLLAAVERALVLVRGETVPFRSVSIEPARC